MKSKWLGLSILCLLMANAFLQIPVESYADEADTETIDPETTSCFRVLIVITSQSDWMILQIVSGARIVAMTHNITEGEDAPDLMCRCDTHENLISMTKKQYDNTLVRIEAKAILYLKGDSDIVFEIRKGDMEYATVDVYNYNTEELFLAKTITVLDVANDPENLVEFRVEKNEFAKGGLDSLKSPVPKLVWAFYYPWYYKEQWNTSDILTDTTLFPHNSSDSEIIQLHINQALAAGIDGFIVSWWGKDSYTDENLQSILDVAEQYDFKISIIFESLGDNGPRSEIELKKMLRDFFFTYGDDERFFRIEGNPVIFVWAAESHEPSVWEDIVSSVEQEGYYGVYIAETGIPEYLNIFDGLHKYALVGIDDVPLLFERLSLICRTYGYLNEGEPYIWAATVCPGYDDRKIPGRVGLYQPRNEGEYYEEMFEAAFNSSPDWLLITSFNEWWENTHIEPSVNYGFAYLEMTARFASTFKGASVQQPELLTAHDFFNEGVELFKLNSYEKAKSKFESAKNIFDKIGYVQKSSEAEHYIEQCNKKMEGTAQEQQEEGETEKQEAGTSVLLLLAGFVIVACSRKLRRTAKSPG